MASEWEARDALGVESDVWKSKYTILFNVKEMLNFSLRYLASSVIVEELEKARQEASARAGKHHTQAKTLSLIDQGKLQSSELQGQLTIHNSLTNYCDHLSEALEHAARRLLGERQGLRQTLASTQQVLSTLVPIQQVLWTNIHT